jgi:hypothetical protein
MVNGSRLRLDAPAQLEYPQHCRCQYGAQYSDRREQSPQRPPGWLRNDAHVGGRIQQHLERLRRTAPRLVAAASQIRPGQLKPAANAPTRGCSRAALDAREKTTQPGLHFQDRGAFFGMQTSKIRAHAYAGCVDRFGQ